MTDLPTSADEVSAEWLSSVTGWDITAVELEQIGVGIGVSSAVFRATLTGDGPSSVIIKMPALDEAAVFTATMLRMYIREVRFFAELAGESPIRCPQGYFGMVDEETSQFVQVMEDLGDLRLVDQTIGMELADAERAVDELATWHAKWWNAADPIVERGTATGLGDQIYLDILPLVFAEGWEQVTAEMDVSEPVLAVGPRWIETMPELLGRLDAAPTTLTHGDYRADNILFAPDGSVALLDFQLTGRASGCYDLAYFVTQSLAPEVASAHERALFDRWVSALIAHGVAEADTAELWDRYRDAALFCLVYPIVGARSGDLSDDRQRELFTTMLDRFARVVDELDLADLLVAPPA